MPMTVQGRQSRGGQGGGRTPVFRSPTFPEISTQKHEKSDHS